jgi:hypothetical protein
MSADLICPMCRSLALSITKDDRADSTFGEIECQDCGAHVEAETLEQATQGWRAWMVIAAAADPSKRVVLTGPEADVLTLRATLRKANAALTVGIAALRVARGSASAVEVMEVALNAGLKELGE